MTRMSLPQPFPVPAEVPRAIIFGSYHHAQTLNCDRIGVVATRNIKPALETLIKSSVRTGSSPGAPIIRLAVTRCRVIASLLLPFLGPKALPVSAGRGEGIERERSSSRHQDRLEEAS